MTDIDALDFLKEHRRILAEEIKVGTLLNYDIAAFDVAINILEEQKVSANRHRITDHEFIEKVREIVDEYIEADEGYDYRYMERIVDLLSDYNEGR